MISSLFEYLLDSLKFHLSRNSLLERSESEEDRKSARLDFINKALERGSLNKEPKPFPFFSLPPELRCQIYGYILANAQKERDAAVTMIPRGRHFEGFRRAKGLVCDYPEPLPALLWSSLQIAQEASEFLEISAVIGEQSWETVYSILSAERKIKNYYGSGRRGLRLRLVFERVSICRSLLEPLFQMVYETPMMPKIEVVGMRTPERWAYIVGKQNSGWLRIRYAKDHNEGLEELREWVEGLEENRELAKKWARTVV